MRPAEPSPPAIALTGATKRYGERVAVDDATLAVRPAELFAVLGPSGSGKTTLLRLIAGFERPDSGTVAIAGRAVSGPRAWVEPERRRVGVVFQDGLLFPHLSVEENVAFGVRGRPDRVREVLDLVGLADRARSHPQELSGGERQRVALARALAPEPDVVLLDEPFSALDASLRWQLRRDVVRILRASRTTAILVTHDQEEALSITDRVAVMCEGRVVQVGVPQEVYWRPADRWVAEFVGEVNLVRGDVSGPDVDTPIGRFRLAGTPTGACSEVAVRPEALGLEADDDGAAVVSWREFRGHDVLYELRHRDLGPLLVQLPSLELFDPGQRVSLRPAGGAVAAPLGER